MLWRALAILALCGLTVPVAAEDRPDMASLPTLATPGTLTAAQMAHQAAWLQVTQTGLYRLSLDGPGLIGLTGFRTADGRSDGSDPQERLVQDGSAYRAGQLDDLLLEQGRAYFLQTAATQTRAVTLEMIQPLDPATIATTDAWEITPGAQTLRRPADRAVLTLTNPGTTPLRLEAILPPGADGGAQYSGVDIGPGGLFPLRPDPEADLRVAGRERLDGSFPLMLLRATAVTAPYYEAEVEANALGPLPPEGTTFRGVLLARSDRDDVDFTLTQTATLDLSLTVQDRGVAQMRLLRVQDGYKPLLDSTATQGLALRQALTLTPGDYRVEISGERLRPSDYTLAISPAAGPPAGEPDDQPIGAQDLAIGTALRGVLAPDDPAHVAFDIATPGHLWELRGVQGLDNLSISDGNDRAVGAWRAQNGAMVLRLGLPPGRYLAFLRGDGPYALRLSDLGPVPAGFEVEPNEADAAAQRLSPGQSVAGDFQTDGDVDLYEITLGAPTPLTLSVTAPDDGVLRTELALDGFRAQVADVEPGAALTYSALFPQGRHIVHLSAREAGVSGRYALSLTRADWPEPEEPQGMAVLPGDGRIMGHVGGLDREDQILVALPPGSGTVALTCQDAPDWRVVRQGAEDTLARGQPGQVVMLDYAADLGPVELRIEGDAQPRPYACRAAFAPGGDLVAVQHEEGEEFTLRPGTRVTGSFADARDGARLVIVAPVGTLVGLRCDTAPEQTRADGGRHVDQALGAGKFADGTSVFLAEAAQAVKLWPREGDFPQAWACDVLGDDAFATPADLSAGSLATPVQVSNDLDLGLVVTGLDAPFRAFSRAGQAADLGLTVRNPGAAGDFAVQISALAEGWRLTPAQVQVTVPAGGQVTLPLRVELPPMQSAASDPQIRVAAQAGTRRAAVTVPFAVDAAAVERGAGPFWAAPAGLRGGLDPMRHGFGGRVVALDGVAVEAQDWAFLHDGEAPQSDVPASLGARVVEIRLAGEAPVAAFTAHLRTTEDRGRWPDRLTLELSRDGQVWGAPMGLDLTATSLPQLFPLPQVQMARFARITRHGCRADPDCRSVALADVGLVALPDWRPGVIDLADTALGGHVVWARRLGGKDSGEDPFGGRWNADFLTAGRGETLRSASDQLGDRVEAVVAFASNRAARIAALEWVGAAGDGDRLAQIGVAFSLTGPAGPWTDGAPLLAPPVGQTTSRQSLQTPVWARAVKFTLRRDADDTLAIPDRIGVIEDPTAPSALGLWQDDSPVAGYEATHAAPLTAPLTPTGGPNAANAAALPLGQTVTSSVQLERNADFWRITLPDGPKQLLTLHFPGAALPEFTATLTPNLPLTRTTTAQGDLILTAPADPGTYVLHISEPPRSVAILWDTSGSVGPYIPRILEAVRVWATSLKPGRDRIQLLPFGLDTMLLKSWAGRAEEVYPTLSALPRTDSSAAEEAMGVAATELAQVDGQRGIVIITDGETGQGDRVWTPLLTARPRVVALSIDSSDPRGVAFLKDWAAINGGYFTRITGSAGLADGLDLAAGLFRAPKPYSLTASLQDIREPEGQARLTLTALKPKTRPKPTGGIEVILDASGSMLKRMDDGQRRIAVAHDALVGLVRKTLPKGTPFAFRAFGLAPDDCATALKIPFGPLNPAAAEKAIRAVPAVNLAKTAIAASLAAAAEDLAQMDPPRVMVLVTDGEETCDGDVPATIAAIRAKGLDIRLSIVGFAVEDAGLAQTFAGWAEQGGGSYIPAGDSEALAAGIAATTEARFAADRLYLDGRVETVATLILTEGGILTEGATLPAGTYRLRPLQTAQGAAVEVTLQDGQDIQLTYDPTTGLVAP